MDDNSKLLTPLLDFYAEGNLSLPSARRVRPHEVPEPQRTLLVHSNDMTPTLERHHGDRIHVRVLKKICSGEVLSRQVVLVLNATEKAAEFGAIRIYMEHLPPEAREQVLEGRRPLGTILHECAVDHASCPNVYFEVYSDAVIGQALGLTVEHKLYGRRNVIFAHSQDMLADIVEILPPMDV